MTTPNWSEFVPSDPYDGDQQMVGAVEAIKAEIGIVEAYRRWCGKMEPIEDRVESIMCSCPTPGHEDKNPSAWMNSDKDVWFCAGCNVGGDQIVLGAIRFGYDPESYKENFRELITILLADLGIDANQFIHSVPGADQTPDREKIDPNEPLPAILKDMDPEEEEPDFDAVMEQPLEWETFIEENTFMDLWMKATSMTIIPNEYLFFLSLQMIALACGDDVLLEGHFETVPNISLTLLGETGNGKSQGIKQAKKVIQDTLPPYDGDLYSKGINLFTRPGSGEALYEMFSRVDDNPPNDPYPVRGLITVNELSEFMSVAQRSGSSLSQAVIQMTDGEDVNHPLRSGNIKVKQPFCCIVTGCQPDALRNVISDQDVVGGFANRFMYVRGTTKPIKKWADQTNKVDFTGLDVALKDIHNWAGVKRHLTVDKNAQERLDQLRHKLEAIKKKHGVMARVPHHMLKLVIVLAANQKTTVITESIIMDAEAMMDFLIPGADLVYTEVGETETNRLTKRILDIVEWYPARRNRQPTQGDIMQEFNSAERKRYKIQILDVIAKLRGQKHIVEAPPTKEALDACKPGQRPPTRYVLSK